MKLPTLPDQATYENPNISGPRLQGRPDAQVPRDMFGARGWQDLARVGEQVQQFASRAAYIYDDYNSTKANEAANAFQRDFLAWQGEANQKKGKFAENTGEEYQKWSQKSLAGLGKGLNEIQKGRFMAMAQDKMSSQQRWANDYGAGERRTYQISELQTTIDVEGQTVFANIGDPDMVEKSLKIMKDSAFSMAQLQGLDEKATMLLMQQAPQKFLAEAISDRIKNGDTGLAAGLLDNYGPQLGGAHATKLTGLLKSERKRQVAEARAEARAAQSAAREAAAEAERGLINQNVGTIISGMDKLPTVVEQREYAYIIASTEEDPKRRDEIISRVSKELTWRENKEKATISRQVSEFQELANAKEWTPQQAEDQLAQAKNLLPQSREKISHDYDGKAQKETPENKTATLALREMIDLGSERGGIDKRDRTGIDAFAYENGLTFKQTQDAHAYAKNNGAAGLVTQTQVNQAWKSLKPGSKNVPADMLELVQSQFAPGKPVTNEQVRKIMSRLVADGETARSSFFSLEAGPEETGPDESYAESLRNERNDKWQGSVPKKDAERIKGKLDLAGIRATPKRIEAYYWDEMGGK